MSTRAVDGVRLVVARLIVAVVRIDGSSLSCAQILYACGVASDGILAVSILIVAVGVVVADIFQRGVVASACADLGGFGDAQSFGNLRLHGADAFIAFKELRHLGFGNSADIQHFLAPDFLLHIQQHAGGIGIVAAVNTGENVVDVILGKHDLCNPRKVLRLIFLHPKDLGGGKSSKGNIGSQLRQLVLADLVIQIVHLLCGSTVIPENRGTDNVIVFIQHHQTVHLAAAADTGNLCAVKAL